MAIDTPDIGQDEQDQAEVFDETNLDDGAEFVTLEEMPDVYDATQALGDSRDIEALDADELDPDALDDEDLEDDEDLDDSLRDSLEDDDENDDLDDLDADDEDGVNRVELDEVELAAVADVDAAMGPGPDQVPDEAHPHQEELLDEGVEETFPASDPVSVKRIT